MAEHQRLAGANVVAVFYDKEEGPAVDNGLEPLYRSGAVPVLDFAFCLEPTDNHVQVGCVGGLHAEVVFRGRRAHSARPWQGENAIHRAGELLAQLHQLGRREVLCEGYPFYEVMTVTRAEGGRARNVVPDVFTLNLNYRFAPGKSLEQAQADVLSLIGQRAEVVFTDLSPSGRVCADNPLFAKLLSDTRLPAQSKQAWTDVARLAMAGIDAVNFGPGETAQALHFLREHYREPITVDDVRRACRLSLRRLQTQFRQYVGRTMREELERLRVNHARALLADRKIKIDSVAHESGFASRFHFVRAFRRATGKSPTEFRMAQQSRKD